MDIDELSRIRENDIRKWTTNRVAVWRLRRRWLEHTAKISCSRCPMHNLENARRRQKNDKYKSKRKGRC